MADNAKIPFVFVPEGEPVPGELLGPEWMRIPATFVPRGGGLVTRAGRPWPRDRLGRPWPRDRRGNPVCPLTELPPGGPVPGENSLDAPDPVAAFRATDAVFRNPAAAAGLVRTAADNAAPPGTSSEGQSDQAPRFLPPTGNSVVASDQQRQPITKSHNWHPDAAVRYLEDPKHGWTGNVSQDKCASAIRRALNAGGIATPNNPTEAKNYVGYLETLGFQHVLQEGYVPRLGDIAVFQALPGVPNNAGHIEIYDGTNWRSDYNQAAASSDDSFGGHFYADRRWRGQPVVIYRMAPTKPSIR